MFLLNLLWIYTYFNVTKKKLDSLVKTENWNGGYRVIKKITKTLKGFCLIHSTQQLPLISANHRLKKSTFLTAFQHPSNRTSKG